MRFQIRENLGEKGLWGKKITLKKISVEIVENKETFQKIYFLKHRK